MSIISSKAEHVYKGNALLQEAYIAGATRQPTEEEIKAACLAIMPYVMAQPSRQVFDSLTKATGCNVSQFCKCFPFTVKAMTAMERDPDGNHKLRPPTQRENEYLLQIAEKWHVRLEES